MVRKPIDQRNPVVLLTVALMLTCALSGGLGWQAYHFQHKSIDTTTRNLRIEQLSGTILRLDVVLTMSARMAAATGDPRWEQRYLAAEPQLDAALREALQMAPEAFSAEGAEKTHAANIRLVEMEKRAFDLIHQGSRDEAHALLLSEEYEKQKQIYSEGMEELNTGLADAVDAGFEQLHLRSLLTVVHLIVLLPLLLIGWVFVFRLVRAWRAALVESNRRLAAQSKELTQLSESLDRKVAERTAALRESESKFRALYETTSDAVMLLDEKGFFDCNFATLRVFGCASREEFCSKHPADLSPPVQPGGIDSMALANQRIATAQGEGSCRFDWVHRRMDGVDFPAEVLLNALQVGDRKVLQAVVRDITERKAAMQSLQESEEKFKAICDSAQDAIIMMDSEGRVTFWNVAADRTFGWTSDEMIGRDLHTLLTPTQFRPAFLQAFPEFQRSGEGAAIGKTLELSALHKSGREFPVEFSLAAIKLKDRWNAIGILRDISQRKGAEAALQRARQDAEVANRAKSDFLANMSHEIRTPMNGIIGMTGLLLDTGLDEERRDYVETIGKSADILLSIINDILDFSKIEAGKMDLEVLDFDLRAMLENMLDMLAIRAQEKGLELTCGIHPDVPALLRGDPGRLRQILTNLVGNAIKFTTVGEVSVGVAMEAETEAEATVRFSVTDTGIGIPEDKQGMLFNAFTQVDASTTRKYGGTGLGLSICKQLCEMMGGRIGVESRPGEGSSFWFTVVLGKQPAPTGSVDEVEISLRERRVLIVDDNTTNRYVLRAQLRSWQCPCDEAEGAGEAMEKLLAAAEAGQPFDIALIDMQMPDIDGETLGAQIKANDQLRNTLLVMLTSMGMRGDAARLGELGFSAYLRKPIKQSLLYDCLVTVGGGGMPMAAEIAERPLVTRHSLDEQKRRRVRILLAEDNPINQKVALAILGKLGYRADAVADGLEALQALADIPYDLVLMDVQMPQMDGLEATRQIRDQASRVRNHAVPVIAMTAHAMKGDREVCLAAGMNDYVTKPVRGEELAAAIERQMGAGLKAASERPIPAAKAGAGDFDGKELWERLGQDQELFIEILEMFCSHTPGQLEELREAARENDPDRLCQRAHAMKGAALNIGAARLAERLLRLETLGREHRLDGVLPLVVDLEAEFGALSEQIAREIKP